MTDVHSGKMKDLNKNPDVNLSFLKKDTSEWLSVSGKCIQVTDPEKIKEMYTEDLHVRISQPWSFTTESTRPGSRIKETEFTTAVRKILV